MKRLLAWCLPTPKRKRARARERFLLPQEWAVLRTVLAHYPQKITVYVSFLLLEGPRMSEARLMQRAHVDLAQGFWHKTVTKNGRRQLLALSPMSCQLLSSLPNDGPYFFPGETPEQPWSRTAIRYWWKQIRREAGIQDVQIRDLRRTCATMMVSSGENLMVIKEILHHSSISTTQIYARADTTVQRGALNRHAKRLFPLNDGGAL
jgi:integrase